MKKKVLKVVEMVAHALSGIAVLGGIVVIIIGATSSPINPTFIWAGIGGTLFGLVFALILHAFLGRSLYSLFRLIHDVDLFLDIG